MNNQWDNQNTGNNWDGQGGVGGKLDGANPGRGQWDNQNQSGQFGGQGGQWDNQSGANQYGGGGPTDNTAWDNSQGQGGFGGQGRHQRRDDFGGQGDGFDSNQTGQGQFNDGGYQNQSSAGVGGNQFDNGYGGGNNPDNSRYAAEGAYGDQSNTGKKPGIGDKLMGSLEKAAGKTTRNPGMVERGEERKTGENW